MPIQQQRVGGRIEHLYTKTARRAETRATPPKGALSCVAGWGIDGDVNAHKLSPRQILVTLQAELEELAIMPGALRENLVISLEDRRAFVPGASLVTSAGVEIALTMYCEPCKRIQHVVPDFHKIMQRRGILGKVVCGGRLKHFDKIFLAPGVYEPLPDSTQERFINFAARIPSGRVVRYIDVTVGMGVADSFVRALPGYIKRAAQRDRIGVPLHRIVDAQGRLPQFIPQQLAKLEQEGVSFGNPATNVVDLQSCLWQG